MASRKDRGGRLLKKGESYRESDGMYIFAYTDSSGKRRYTYSKSLLTLRDKEKAILRDQLDGIDTGAGQFVNLNKMFDIYMSTKLDLRETTRQGYLDTYRRYVRKDFGKKKIVTIKYTDVLKFYTDLLVEKKLHVSTIKRIQRLIRPTLELAVRDNIIRTNPADGVIKMLSKKNMKESVVRHALTMEQQRAFLNYIDVNPLYDRWYPLLVFMFGTGCRVGEVIGLRWDDIDFEKRQISINHSITYMANRQNGIPTGWVLNDPKTESGTRIIPMVEAVYQALQREKTKQDIIGERCVTEVEGMKNFIFFNKNHEIYIPEGINKLLHRAVTKYNEAETIRALEEKREPELLPQFSCHYIRHTFCARLCEADMNIKAIQAVMGHRDIQTTLDIYAEVSEKKKKESLNKVFDNMDLF